MEIIYKLYRTEEAVQARNVKVCYKASHVSWYRMILIERPYFF